MNDLLADMFGANDDDWMADPNRVCRPTPGATPQQVRTHADQWFPPDTVTARTARRLCAECPVRAACLRHALDNGEAEGVWGGTTPDVRRRRLRKTGAVA